MNVALPALIVFFLLLPGFIFSANLKRAERTSLDYSPFGQVVAEAILWALLLHIAWLGAAHFLCGHDVEPVTLMQLLSSAPAIQATAAEAVGRQFNWIAAYVTTLVIVSFGLPSGVRRVISGVLSLRTRSRAPTKPMPRTSGSTISTAIRSYCAIARPSHSTYSTCDSIPAPAPRLREAVQLPYLLPAR